MEKPMQGHDIQLGTVLYQGIITTVIKQCATT